MVFHSIMELYLLTLYRQLLLENFGIICILAAHMIYPKEVYVLGNLG